MRSCCRLALSILVIIAFVSGVSAEETWRKETVQHGNQVADRYLMDIPGASCNITAYEDGTVIVNVYDYDWNNKIVFQSVSINTQKQTIKKFLSVTQQNSTSVSVSSGYDVFNEKFRSFAEKLPPEVRALFGGQWDIK